MTLHERGNAKPSTSEHTNKTEPLADEPGQPMTIISHAEMNAAYQKGLVTPLGQRIAYAVHYDDTWWIHYEGGWIRTDQTLADTLDAEAERITAQDTIIARNAAIRQATRNSNEQE